MAERRTLYHYTLCPFSRKVRLLLFEKGLPYGMIFETKIATEEGVCEKEYGERLLKIINKALQIPPVSQTDFAQIGEEAQKARSDKKNTSDGVIKMAVAKAENEWTMLGLDFESYRAALMKHSKNL